MIEVYGVQHVARWCGVSQPTVSNWRDRCGGWPVEPAVCLISGRRRLYGWTEDQRPDWEKFAAGYGHAPGPDGGQKG